MTKPVSHSNLEDVLASVKRLVSEEKRPSRAETMRDAVPESGASDRFVLTPSFRVEASQEPRANDTHLVDAPSGVVQTSLDTEISDSFEQVADLVEAVVEEEVAQIVHLNAPKANDAAEVLPAATPNPDLPRDEDTLERTAEAESLRSKIAALEAVIGKRQEDWEPEIEVAPVPSPDFKHTQDTALANLDALVKQTRAQDATPTMSDLQQAMAQEPASEPQADIVPEAPFIAIGEEDGAEDLVADNDGIATDETSSAIPQFLRKPRAPMPQELDEDSLVAEAVAAPAIDEENLRLVVADLVRQELQGALGERITRNVRKLVRREIHRALAARDFE